MVLFVGPLRRFCGAFAVVLWGFCGGGFVGFCGGGFGGLCVVGLWGFAVVVLAGFAVVVLVGFGFINGINGFQNVWVYSSID